MEGLTDDTKVGRPSASACSANSRPGAVPVLRGWQLRTLAAAAMSPAATLALLHCPLPTALVRSIAGERFN